MITCRQAVDYISKKEEGKLTLTQRAGLSVHLIICRFCRVFSKHNRAMVVSSQNPAHKGSHQLTQAEKDALIRYMEELG